MGVNPPADPEAEVVRQQFAKLYPGLAKLEAKQAELEKLLEHSGDYDSQLSHYWSSYGQSSVDRLFALAAESYGVQSLPEETKRILYATFSGFVNSSPEIENRYATDPKFVDEYWRAIQFSLIDPARRTASAQVLSRVPGNLPQDTPSGAVRTSSPAPQPKDLDERASQMWALFNQNKQNG